MLSVQERSQDWAAQAGLWVLVDSRRERLEVPHTVLVAERHIAPVEAGHILAGL